MGFAKFYQCPEWALSLVGVSSLVRLDYLGLAFPVRSPYVPYSVTNIAGNKLAIGDGFPSCEWQYPDAGLTREMWARFNAFLGGAAGAFVYLRTTNNDESGFANFYGMMKMPPLNPAGYNVRAYDPLTIQFSALVEQ